MKTLFTFVFLALTVFGCASASQTGPESWYVDSEVDPVEAVELTVEITAGHCLAGVSIEYCIWDRGGNTACSPTVAECHEQLGNASTYANGCSVREVGSNVCFVSGDNLNCFESFEECRRVAEEDDNASECSDD